MSLPALALTLSVALFGQVPLSTRAELPGGETVELAADQLLYEPSKQILTARGNTVLSTDRLTLRAEEVVYDEAKQTATARGNVMIVSGTFAGIADEITVDIQTLEATMSGGLFMQKKDVTEEALLAARTPDELRKLGTTAVTITGTKIKRLGENRFSVDGLAFTPCDCDPTEPTWRVEASSADVEMGERAILHWPIVYVHKVPVFALPWLYLPLSERRTGLLVPKPNFAAQYGFALEQPIFFALGRSYDLTFTPGYYFGGSNPANGIQGPRLLSEFRYVPSHTTNGRVSVGVLYDLKKLRDPFRGTVLENTERGWRGEASLQHTQELGDGFHDKVDLSVVSDGYYPRDVTADIVARENQFLRSTGVLYHRAPDRWAGLDVAIRQDLRFGTKLLGRTPDVDGQQLDGPNTIQRFPALTLAYPERPLWGRINGGLRLELARLAPILGSSGDEGLNGIFRAQDADLYGSDFELTQGNRRFDPGEREGRNRLDLVPRLSASYGLGSVARLAPSLSWRQNVWIGEYSGRPEQRGYPIAALSLESELARVYGPKVAPFRHSLSPAFELRSIPFVLGGAPRTTRTRESLPAELSEEEAQQILQQRLAYDEIDAAIPDLSNAPFPGLVQGVVELRQKLFQRGEDKAIRELASLTLGQGFELLAPGLEQPRVAETYARLAAASGAFRTHAVVRVDTRSQVLTQLSAGLGLDNGRGTAVYAQYDDLLLQGSNRLRRGIDVLVAPALELNSTDRAQQLTGGLRTALPWGVGFRYEAIVQPSAPLAKISTSDPSSGQPSERLAPAPVRWKNRFPQQVIGLSYGPACDCWRIEGQAVIRPAGAQDRLFAFPDFGVSLSIARFGSFGS